MRPDFPFRPAAVPFYYGWVVLVAATVGLVMSAPGQTIGVAVFTEALLEATGLSRLALSNAYLVGTLASGLLLPWVGTQIDRFGTRRGVIAASIGLGLVLVYLSQVDRVAARVAERGLPGAPTTWALLTLGFLGLRFTGQGTLTLVSRTMLGQWFERHRGLVSAITAPFSTLAFASSPLLLAGWVASSGWRAAWVEMALTVGVGMSLFGWLLFRDTPEQCGLEIDGGPAPVKDVATDEAPPPPRRDYTRGEALRTSAFWLVTLGIASHAMVGTGMALHIVDLGAESGLAEAEALRVFLPVTILSIPTALVIGWAVDRFPMRFLIMAMLLGQAGMFGLAPHLGERVLGTVCLASWGISSGFYGPLTVAALPNFFGRTHLGAIQGSMMMIVVIASALGPAALAGGKAVFGSYAGTLYALAGLPLLLFAAAPFTRDPQQ